MKTKQTNFHIHSAFDFDVEEDIVIRHCHCQQHSTVTTTLGKGEGQEQLITLNSQLLDWNGSDFSLVMTKDLWCEFVYMYGCYTTRLKALIRREKSNR